ncbi:MAG TPA: succinate dehydrogenase cytochrome b subunit [Vicinamibacterales bacterium]|nr:succinate dehydrogenase cytochrome b subunit [Vicinamibacterales bacterium]
MSSRFRVFATSVGTKLLIGITGLALFLFLITHIAGNALIFLGPATFNSYSHTLTSNPLVPILEIGLLLIFLVHIYKTVTMFLGNQQARPIAYKARKSRGRPSRKSLSSSTMIVSGLWLLVFVIIHVRGFKYGPEYAVEGSAGVRDLYRLVVEAFRSPLMVGFYVISMVTVASHLWHGASSTFQSLGLDHSRWTPRLLALGKVFAVIIGGGFIVITLWVHFAGQVGQ